MQITGMLQIQATVGEESVVERLDEEIARVQALSDEAIEALSTLIDANDPLDVVRKLYRFMAALASPAAVLGRAFERDPDGLPGFCLNLAAYRAYMDRLERGVVPVEAAREVEEGRRIWLARAMREHRVPPSAMRRHGGGETSPNQRYDDQRYDDQDLDGDDIYAGEDDIDVYDVEGEIDAGVVRAEIDRLLRRLHVDPDRIDVTIRSGDGLGRPGEVTDDGMDEEGEPPTD